MLKKVGKLIKKKLGRETQRDWNRERVKLGRSRKFREEGHAGVERKPKVKKAIRRIDHFDR
jgi:hypothetical protein